MLPKSIKNTFGEVPFSFETDYLQTAVNSINFLSYQCNDYFIDIGIPQDYERANRVIEKPQ